MEQPSHPSPAANPPPFPPDEQLRLAALERLGALHTHRDPLLDAIASAAARIAATPVALVTLIGRERQWIRANVGLEGVDSTPREVAFCSHTILQEGPLIVGDARADIRFATNPQVTAGIGVTFYAGFPLRDEAGQGLGALCVLDHAPRELSTAQRDALDALAKIAMVAIAGQADGNAMQALRDFTENAPAEIHICRAADLRLVYANRAGLRRIDDNPVIARQLLPQLALHGLQDWMAPARFAELLREVAAARIPREVDLRRTNSSAAQYLARVVPFESAGRDYLGVALVNISERERADRAQLAELERWKQALQASGDCLWDWDVQSGATHYDAEWTRLLELHGDRLEPIYSAWRERIHPEDADRAQADMSACFRGEQPRLWSEFRLRTGTGDYKHVLCRGRVVTRDDLGRPLRVTGTVKDATRRRVALDSLEASNEALEARVRQRTASLEAANRDLSLFASAAAHDLAAPIRTIAGFTGLLRASHAEALPAQAQDLLGRIETGVARMQRLLDALTILFRASERDPASAPVDVRSVVEQIVAVALARLDRTRVRVSLGNLPACIGDEALIGIVFTNLIGNALKFSAERALAVVEVGCTDDGHGPVYFVRDNGVGFDPAGFPGLFKPFQRLHATSRFDGSGIGLATVARIIRRCGGRIWVEAAPDLGATFHFHFEPRVAAGVNSGAGARDGAP